MPCKYFQTVSLTILVYFHISQYKILSYRGKISLSGNIYNKTQIQGGIQRFVRPFWNNFFLTNRCAYTIFGPIFSCAVVVWILLGSIVATVCNKVWKLFSTLTRQMWFIGDKGVPALCFQTYLLCPVWSFEEMFGGALGFCLDFFQNSFICPVQDLQWILTVCRPVWQARSFLKLLNSLKTFRFIPLTLLCSTFNTKTLSFLPHIVCFDTWDYLSVLLYFLLDVAVLPGRFFSLRYLEIYR